MPGEPKQSEDYRVKTLKKNEKILDILDRVSHNLAKGTVDDSKEYAETSREETQLIQWANANQKFLSEEIKKDLASWEHLSEDKRKEIVVKIRHEKQENSQIRKLRETIVNNQGMLANQNIADQKLKDQYDKATLGEMDATVKIILNVIEMARSRMRKQKDDKQMDPILTKIEKEKKDVRKMKMVIARPVILFSDLMKVHDHCKKTNNDALLKHVAGKNVKYRGVVARMESYDNYHVTIRGRRIPMEQLETVMRDEKNAAKLESNYHTLVKEVKNLRSAVMSHGGMMNLAFVEERMLERFEKLKKKIEKTKMTPAERTYLKKAYREVVDMVVHNQVRKGFDRHVVLKTLKPMLPKKEAA